MPVCPIQHWSDGKSSINHILRNRPTIKGFTEKTIKVVIVSFGIKCTFLPYFEQICTLGYTKRVQFLQYPFRKIASFYIIR